MWHYVTTANSRVGEGSITYDEYKRKIANDCQRVVELIAELEQKGIRSEQEYGDSVWVWTDSDYELTALSFVLMRLDCEIKPQPHRTKEQGIAND